MFSKSKTPEALRLTAATLVDRARQAAADAIAARSQAADSFAEGADDAARAALTKAAALAAEAEALEQAAVETEARANEAKVEAQRTAYAAKVAGANKAIKAAGAVLSREVPTLMQALDKIAAASWAAVTATAEAATAETEETADLPCPIAFAPPSLFVAAGPINPHRLSELVATWADKG